MGARGPQPKPTALKRLEGNPGKRRLNDAEVVPVGSLRKPSIITGPAAEEWDRVINSMPPGFFTAADAPVLATYCIAWVVYRNALAIIARKPEEGGGMEAKGSQGQPVAHPQLTVLRAYSELILKCGDRLGMSPAARARMTMGEDQNPHAEFAGLIGGRSAFGEATH